MHDGHERTDGHQRHRLLGTPGSLPVLQGQYATPRGGASSSAANDRLDAGDVDLIVVSQYDGSGLYVLRNRLSDRVTAARERSTQALPSGFSLSPSYPNPFNPGTVIRLHLPDGAHATVAVYNIAGQRVRTLLNAWVHAGPHELAWDGADDDGNAVAAGVYLSRAEAGGRVLTGKMVKVE